MKTGTELSKDVCNFVGNPPEDTEAQAIALSGINDGINRFNAQNWSWQLTTSGFGFVADTSTYALPSDFRAPRTLHGTDTNGVEAVRVQYADPKTFDDRADIDATSGDPCHYTVLDPYPSGEIRLDVPPSSSFISTYPSGQIRYYARIPNLSTSSATLNVPPEVESAIVWYAKSYVAAIYAPDKIGYAEGRFSQQYRLLRRDETEMATVDW